MNWRAISSYQVDWDAAPDWISGVGTLVAAGIAVLIYYWQRRDAIRDRNRAKWEAQLVGTFALSQEALALQIFAEVWAHRFAKQNLNHLELAKTCQKELERDRPRDLQVVLSNAPATLSLQYIGVLNSRVQLATAVDQMVLLNSEKSELALEAATGLHGGAKVLIAECVSDGNRLERLIKKTQPA